MEIRIFRVEANVEGETDVVYFKADTLDDAKRKFGRSVGFVPEQYLTWTEVDELPEGEGLMAEPDPS